MYLDGTLVSDTQITATDPNPKSASSQLLSNLNQPQVVGFLNKCYKTKLRSLNCPE